MSHVSMDKAVRMIDAPTAARAIPLIEMSDRHPMRTARAPIAGAPAIS
jgi:hypothetical protein